MLEIKSVKLVKTHQLFTKQFIKLNRILIKYLERSIRINYLKLENQKK